MEVKLSYLFLIKLHASLLTLDGGVWLASCSDCFIVKERSFSSCWVDPSTALDTVVVKRNILLWVL